MQSCVFSQIVIVKIVEEKQGYLVYPMYPNGYSQSVCKWNIVAAWGEVSTLYHRQYYLGGGRFGERESG